MSCRVSSENLLSARGVSTSEKPHNRTSAPRFTPTWREGCIIFFLRQGNSELDCLGKVVVMNVENNGVFDAVEVGAIDMDVKMRRFVLGPGWSKAESNLLKFDFVIVRCAHILCQATVGTIVGSAPLGALVTVCDASEQSGC
jgi:hypothetical protein